MSEIYDFLFLGPYKLALDKSFLEKNKIKFIIWCGDYNTPYTKTITYKKINLLDNLSEDISSHFIYCYECKTILAYNLVIEKARRGKGNVMVHWLKGMSRSASIVTSYVMVHSKLAFPDALK